MPVQGLGHGIFLGPFQVLGEAPFAEKGFV